MGGKFRATAKYVGGKFKFVGGKFKFVGGKSTII